MTATTSTPASTAQSGQRGANSRAGEGAPDPQSADPARGQLSRARERELVTLAQGGDMGAFREIYEAHAPQVFRFAIMPLARDRALAEDLLADTFVRAMEKLPQFKWQGRGLLPWLVRIGKNLTLDHLRRAGKQAAWPEGLEQSLPEPSALLDAEHAVGRNEVASVLGDRIAICLEGLNPRYQRVIDLRLVQKCSRADAAAQLDVTVGTLDVLLFRACKAFRKAYVAKYGAEAGDPALFAP